MYKSFSIVVVCVLAANATTTVHAQFHESTFDAASGKLPDDGCGGWSPSTNPNTTAMIVNDELVLVTTANSDNLSYLQSSPAVGTPAQLVLSFRMRFVSGSSATDSRAAGTVGFTMAAQNRKGVLIIEDGTIALLSAENVRGPDVDVATSDALHDYRIEVDTATDEIDVYHDDGLVLEGNTFTDPAVTAPRVFWGEGSIHAHGETHWSFFQHNASTVAPTNLICGDPIGEASLVGDDAAGLITASDALLALRASVGSVCCEACACDVNDSGGITATDALLILRTAIGTGVPLVCPVCE